MSTVSDTYTEMSQTELLGRLAKMAPTSAKAALTYQAIVDDDWFHSLAELRRRFRDEKPMVVAEEPHRTPSGRFRRATSVEIDPDRFRRFWNDRRVKMIEVSRSIGRSDAWANAICSKRSAGIGALDELAAVWNLSLDQLVFAIGTDRERERVGLIK